MALGTRDPKPPRALTQAGLEREAYSRGARCLRILAWGCVLAALSLLAASSVPINPALGEEGAVAGAAGRRDSPVSNTGFPGGEYREPHITPA